MSELVRYCGNETRGADLPSAPWHAIFHGERRNDHHTTLAEKAAARDAAKENE